MPVFLVGKLLPVSILQHKIVAILTFKLQLLPQLPPRHQPQSKQPHLLCVQKVNPNSCGSN